MDIEDAIDAEIGGFSPSVQLSPLAATAVRLAHLLDQEEDSRDAATLSRELRATMGELRNLAAARPVEADPVDEFTERRARRKSTA